MFLSHLLTHDGFLYSLPTSDSSETVVRILRNFEDADEQSD